MGPWSVYLPGYPPEWLGLIEAATAEVAIAIAAAQFSKNPERLVAVEAGGYERSRYEISPRSATLLRRRGDYRGGQQAGEKRESVKEWVNARLDGDLKKSVPEQREAAKELKTDGHSNPEAAEVVGADETTVSPDIDATANTAPVPDRDPAPVAALVVDEKLRAAEKAAQTRPTWHQWFESPQTPRR